MNAKIPANADSIFVEWLTRVGGLRISAWTDARRDVFLGLYTLNRMGRPNGLPCWLRRDTLQSDFVIGFQDDCEPSVIGMDAYVDALGLHLVLYLPPDAIHPMGFTRELFSPWGSAPPSYGLIVRPYE